MKEEQKSYCYSQSDICPVACTPASDYMSHLRESVETRSGLCMKKRVVRRSRALVRTLDREWEKPR